MHTVVAAKQAAAGAAVRAWKLGNALSKVLHLGSLAVQPHDARPGASARETSCSFKVLSIAAVWQTDLGDGSREHESQLAVLSLHSREKCLSVRAAAAWCNIALLPASSVSAPSWLIPAKTPLASWGWFMRLQLSRLQMWPRLLLTRGCGRGRHRDMGSLWPCCW